MKKQYIGIDIGGTNITLGVVNEEYEIVLRDTIKTRKERPYKEICGDLVQLIRKTMQQPDIQNVQWIGIGCPGICDAENGIVYSSKNLGWNDVPLKLDVGQALELPVFVDNDANVAAYGEYIAGAAKGEKSVVVITIGTGVGSGIIIDGKLFYGEHYAGGEIGHTVIDINGPKCGCGRYGCFEVFSSGSGLIRMTREALKLNPSSKLQEFADRQKRVSARTAFLAASAGDETAKEVIADYIRYLACGLGNVINAFRPNRICIGGGVCNEGDNLIIPLRKALEGNYLADGTTPFVSVVACTLGNDAGIIGASMLGQMSR